MQFLQVKYVHNNFYERVALEKFSNLKTIFFGDEKMYVMQISGWFEQIQASYLLNIGIELYVEKTFCMIVERNFFPVLPLLSMNIVVITASKYYVNSKNGRAKICLLMHVVYNTAIILPLG